MNRLMVTSLLTAVVAVMTAGSLLCSRTLLAQETKILAVVDIEDNSTKLNAPDVEAATSYLRALLAESERFEVVDKGRLEEKRATVVAELKMESHSACVDDKCRLRLGKAVSADTMLSCAIGAMGSQCTLSCEMVDLEKETSETAASERFPCNEDALPLAVEKVAQRLRGEGAARDSRISEGKIGETQEDWTLPASAKTVVSLESEPAGAVVTVDEQLVCKSTPCSETLEIGPHTVSMQAKHYDTRTETVVFDKGARLAWNLTARVGWLTVLSVPSELAVELDGRDIGKTPVQRLPVDPGGHEVVVRSPCFFDSGERIAIEKGEERTVEAELVPKQGAIDVSARDADGDAVIARVMVDGQYVGDTPGVFKAPICKCQVQVVRNGALWERAVSLKEKQIARLQAVFPALPALDKVLSNSRREIVSVPGGNYTLTSSGKESKRVLGGFCLDRLEVSLTDYEECVVARKCKAIAWSACVHLEEEDRKKTKRTGISRPSWHKDDHPAICVSPQEAEEYCRFRGGYLPSSAQWEAAARGLSGFRFPWGHYAPSADLANGCANECEFTWGDSGSYRDGFSHTAPVGSHPDGRSDCGAEDMSGNVWEWALLGKGKPVARGGAWNSNVKDLTCSQEYASVDMQTRWNSIGFRCAYEEEVCEDY